MTHGKASHGDDVIPSLAGSGFCFKIFQVPEADRQ